jgi:hypothetical protein
MEDTALKVPPWKQRRHSPDSEPAGASAVGFTASITVSITFLLLVNYTGSGVSLRHQEQNLVLKNKSCHNKDLPKPWRADISATTRMLVETWMVMAILRKSQVEMGQGSRAWRNDVPDSR